MDWCNHCGHPANPFQGYQPCSTSTGDPCLPCRKIAQVELQILKAKKALDLLMIQRSELKMKANQVHNPFAHHLPTEILSYIFKLCLPRAPFDFDNQRGNEVDIYASLKLGAVCTTWRQIAWSTPQLWTLVPVHFSWRPDRNPANCGLIKAWMERAGKRPLHILVSSGMGESHPEDDSLLEQLWPIIYLINTYSHRWQTLDLDRLPCVLLEKIQCSKATSHLQAWRLKLDHFNDSDSSDSSDENDEHEESDEDEPDFSTMRVRIGRIRQKLLDISWTNLTVFFSTGLFSSECYHFLENVPQLTSATFLDVAYDESSTISTDQPFTHPSLSHLKLHSLMEYTDHFLDNITFPALKHLHVELLGFNYFLTMFFQHPLTSLESLVIDVESNHASIFQCQEALEAPNVKRLMVSGFRLIGDNGRGTTFLRHLGRSCGAVGCDRVRNDSDIHSPVLPNLQHLTIQDPGRDDYQFHWHDILMEFKKALVDRDVHIHSALRSITLSLSSAVLENDTSRSCIDKDVIRGFVDVIRSGVPLRIIKDFGNRTGVDLIKTSMDFHKFSPEDIEEYLALAASIEVDVEEWQDWGSNDSLLALHD